MPKRKETKVPEDMEYTESMGHAEVEPMAEDRGAIISHGAFINILFKALPDQLPGTISATGIVTREFPESAFRRAERPKRFRSTAWTTCPLTWFPNAKISLLPF